VKGQDITDYHIDALARFVRPGVVLIQLPDEVIPGDPFSRAAWETHDILKASPHVSEIIVIPEPRTSRVTSADFVASYVNYYLCNGAVIAAQFGDRATDRIAEDMLGELYPDREIVMMNVDAIGEVGGGIHCATQQQPVA
ncbi:MAG: agmatine deiminase family protein, partial [Paracoccaceae bacterium]|nr:agmatine deiminase family protein [Paracoccaceae bacterium]